MMEVIEDLPENVVGIAARGEITHKDYEGVLIPAIEKALEDHDKVRLLYQIGDFEGMEMAAMWDDTRFGLQHWTDFSHLALVTDVEWIKNMTAFFAWMIPAKVRVYPTAEAQDARDWICGVAKEEAA